MDCAWVFLTKARSIATYNRECAFVMKTGAVAAKSMRVLLVDDHALVRDGIASLLEANNIDVIGEAGDGLKALEKARQLNPDIILMDINMPRCNGLEATRLIKAEMPQIKIIILTASDDDYQLGAIKNGADGYLDKLFRAEELLTLLSEVIRGEDAGLAEPSVVLNSV